MEIFIGILILALVVWIIVGFWSTAELLDNWNETTWRYDFGYRALFIGLSLALWLAAVTVLIVVAYVIGAGILGTHR